VEDQYGGLYYEKIKWTSSAAALIAVAVTRTIFETIGFENMSMNVQLIIIGFVPFFIVIAILKFTKNNNKSKHLICSMVMITIIAILIGIMIAIQEKKPQTFNEVKLAFIILITILFLLMLIILIIGLKHIDHSKK